VNGDTTVVSDSALDLVRGRTGRHGDAHRQRLPELDWRRCNEGAGV